MLRWLHGLAVLALLTTAAAPAAAYCRATTCDPARGHCSPDAAGCLQEGYRVGWESDCITVSVQGGGATSAGISYDALRASVERAFEAWTSVACPGGGMPSIHVEVQGPVSCSLAEYNGDKGNANIVMVRDESWPYAGQSPDALGFTRINFDLDSGALFDADIELNGFEEPLAVGRMPKAGEVDLDSVMTHEVGHLLGLDHSTDLEATMRSGYEKGSIELRTPSADDIAGICEIYPPGRQAKSNSCEPRHGFSELCGADQPEAPEQNESSAAGDDADSSSCSSSAAPSAGSPAGLLWAALLLLRRARGRR
jgi:hypothetical protein